MKKILVSASGRSFKNTDVLQFISKQNWPIVSIKRKGLSTFADHLLMQSLFPNETPRFNNRNFVSGNFTCTFAFQVKKDILMIIRIFIFLCTV